MLPGLSRPGLLPRGLLPPAGAVTTGVSQSCCQTGGRERKRPSFCLVLREGVIEMGIKRISKKRVPYPSRAELRSHSICTSIEISRQFLCSNAYGEIFSKTFPAKFSEDSRNLPRTVSQ